MISTPSRTVPMVLAFIGSAVTLTSFILRQGQWSQVPAWIAPMAAVAGAALLLAGVTSLLFSIATGRSFEWFLAWRYLRTSSPSWGTMVVGLILIALAVLCWLPVNPLKNGWSPPFPVHPAVVVYLPWISLGFGIAGWLTLLFGILLLSFSVFTCISIFGVHLGTAALVVVLSVMGGFEQDLRKKILGTRAHVVVTAPDRMFSDYRQAFEKVSGVPGVAAVSPYLEGEVMVTSQTNLAGVLLRGIEIDRISQVTDLRRYLKASGGAGSLENLERPEVLARFPVFGGLRDLGRPDRFPDMLDAPEPLGENTWGPRRRWIEFEPPPRPVYPGIIIGSELALNLRLDIGEDVNLVSPLGGMSPMGPMPKSRPFRVAGIFYSGMYEYDTKFAYITLPEAQRFLGLDDEVTGLEIKADHVEHALPVAANVRNRLGKSYRVRDWQQINQSLFSALKLEKFMIFFLLTFIVLVACFSIVTNLVTIVLQKVKEIAALKAIGAASTSLMRVFIYSGLYIGVIGVSAGVVEGIAICTYLAHIGLPLDPEVYYIAQLPVRIAPRDIGAVAIAATTLCLLATIYPPCVPRSYVLWTGYEVTFR